MRCRHRRLPYAYGWVGFKKTVKFPQYLVCTSCWLPQGRNREHLPADHPVPGSLSRCAQDDMCVQVIWYIRYDKGLWAAACRDFPDLAHIGTVPGLAKWIAQTKGGGGHLHNGAELVVWLWSNFKSNEGLRNYIRKS